MRKSVIFAAPGKVVVQTEPIPQPQPGELMIQTLISAISAGTELLFLRGQVPTDMEVDSAIPALNGTVRYPLRYGYACVGCVTRTGEEKDKDWIGRTVFAFHPHTSHFIASTAQIIPVPGDLTPHQAVFLPNMETAVNLVMDGQPGIGERVAVIGLGVVGLLTVALLARFPLESLLAVDPLPQRRNLALAMGAHVALRPEDLTERATYDLVYEVSGAPVALNTALALTGFAGRIVIGSWYGLKQAPLDLGGAFHRSRIRLLASQVSTIDPRWSGRWDKKRRIDVAWAMLRSVDTERLITHRLPVEEAPAAYRMLEQEPEHTLQVLFEYPSLGSL
ncbi:MAG: oxidoreductase [Caldilinea sp.]|uniref:Putative oxidoreductase n=1 Tax=Caldilinea aerophila (strain DSM 14535 / JCM 11387 / NBRC 104270 / STL-6-O1) TaxID=926550 RepID=I0I7G2_CALAS|nr:putative oxidoreductase [Caldilinea aerophila DSM 14535 = NBRC 104270]GIV72542.1 MAG: oxidoreductase [Caldilinea sp.]